MSKLMYTRLIRAVVGLLIASLILMGGFPVLKVKIDIGQYTKINFSVENAPQEDTPSSVVYVNPTTTPPPTEPKVIAPVYKTELKTPFIPVRLVAPDIQLDTKIVPVKTVDNTLNAPLDFNVAGWSENSGLAGSKDTVMLDGHYDSRMGQAVFFNLKYLKLNQKMTVYSKEGTSFNYKVVCIESYDRFKAPNEKIFKNDGTNRMNLITCDGTFNKQLGSYDRRLVIYTVLTD